MSCSVVIRATHVVMQRAKLQEAADALALGALQHSDESLKGLSNMAGVAILSVSRSEDSVHIEVHGAYGTAFSEASTGI